MIHSHPVAMDLTVPSHLGDSTAVDYLDLYSILSVEVSSVPSLRLLSQLYIYISGISTICQAINPRAREVVLCVPQDTTIVAIGRRLLSLVK